jgi:hypothetical protein
MVLLDWKESTSDVERWRDRQFGSVNRQIGQDWTRSTTKPSSTGYSAKRFRKSLWRTRTQEERFSKMMTQLLRGRGGVGHKWQRPRRGENSLVRICLIPDGLIALGGSLGLGSVPRLSDSPGIGPHSFCVYDFGVFGHPARKSLTTNNKIVLFCIRTFHWRHRSPAGTSDFGAPLNFVFNTGFAGELKIVLMSPMCLSIILHADGLIRRRCFFLA